MKILIVGAGGHGQVVADIFRTARSIGSDAELLGYLDDRKGLHEAILAGTRVLGPLALLPSLPHDVVLVAIGDNKLRAAISRRLVESGTHFGLAIHPAAVVSVGAAVGDGSMICAGAIVNTATSIGRGVILNTGCTVDHHTTISDFVHVAPGVHMGGEVHVAEGALVGIGAVVLPRVKIGAWATIGAGAVVIRDVPDGATVVGNPARMLRRPIAQSV